MKWPTYWPRVILSLLVVGLECHKWTHEHSSPLVEAAEWTTSRKLEVSQGYARDQVRSLWYHGFDSYMSYGRGPDWQNPANIATNDVAGNFSVTLIDALDTLVILNDRPGFETAVRNVIDWVSFDVDTKPQVFETTIRVLGGLLSGHLYASQTDGPFHLPWYRSELLDMAHDLGERLLPAFNTPTGMPHARINLKHGLLRTDALDSCTAGAGSLILEFGTLSRLTGDSRFEKAAIKAFFAIWNRKSDIGLVGNTINTWTGKWLQPEVSSIGAGIDSFFEYALKWYVMSGEVEFLDVWQEAYAAVMRYSRAPDGFWGDQMYGTFDSLSAFWPGLQVLAGDLENAIKSHMTYWNIWRGHSGLPEIWDMNFRQGTSMQYPLRPEFVESTWYLYRATHDPFYLDVGGRILYDITTRAKVKCGLASIKDLRTNAQEDRMESFVLSETLKYLYLLFDEANPIHADDSNHIMTTEGHVLWLDQNYLRPISSVRRKLRGAEQHQCPAYELPLVAYDNAQGETGLTAGIRARADTEYIRQLIGVRPSDLDTKRSFPSGWCEIPRVNLFSYDFILSAGGQYVPEDFDPSPDKLAPVRDGYILYNISGIRAHIVNRLDGKGYDLTKLGPYAVKTGQLVYVSDPDLGVTPVDAKAGSSSRIPDVDLRFYVDHVDPLSHLRPGMHEMTTEVFVTASTALFGGDPTVPPPVPGQPPLKFGHGEGVRVTREPTNSYGCLPYSRVFEGDAVLVQRGKCTFLEKLVGARTAGASGVVVVSDEELMINPSAGAEELAGFESTIKDAVVVVLKHSAGEAVTNMLDAAEQMGFGHVMVAVEPEAQPATNDRGELKNASRDMNRVLYLNGHPLLNTRLMV
ncbi:glycoside hydrolase family 47 protein [Postia placenta MAD-698-R-SB12]|uniref:alpha-1,2-Mannosidase n=1 Tax=Postia placenta MAD-698-R-SB12 TaxID=670580 RepID=A0A1X6MVQ0_9APHY|nr:glycoside hydrolase family 47 protein [Postia placenta MAD-698-R-SB12]OSX60455.1 glycoside hydrolase family 47 protein [Postia placenta MAD-698-R-SB12]